jgi:hypothetical protein
MTEPGFQRRSRARPRTTPKPQPQRATVAKFSHRTEAHSQACDTCHTFPSANWKSVRATAVAFPDVTEYPTHGSCLGCHREQFFARERPAPKICSVCHVGVTPRFTARHPFQNPSEKFLASDRGRDFTSEFRIRFPHEPHLALMGRAAGGEETAIVRVTFRQEAKGAGVCATCHQTYKPAGASGDEFATTPPAGLGDRFWLKKGTFQASPNSHESCFSCHSADSGLKPAPSDCATCHTLAPSATRADFDPSVASAMGVVDPVALRRWKRRDSSATFRHEGGFHAELACTSCHDVAALDGSGASSAKVRVPSCGGEMGCHVTATLDDGGVLNFEIEQRRSNPGFNCTKCHLAFGGDPIPAGHLDAIAALRAK